MSFGFDPSIILSRTSAPTPTPSINETLQTLAQLQSSRTQDQLHQATLAELLRQQGKEQQLSDIYKANALSQGALPTALLQGGFGPQAFQAQDQTSQMLTAEAMRGKLAADAQEKIREVQDAHRKRVGELFSTVTDQPSWDAAVKELAQEKDPMLSLYAGHMPEKFDPAVAQRLGALAMTAKDRAELADKAAGRTQTDKRIDIEGRRADAMDRRAAAMESRLARETGGGGALPFGITPEALDQQVDAYHATGVLPSAGLGKSGQAIRAAIINRHAEKYPEADIAGAKAGYASDTKSLAALQKQADFVQQFENTAEANLKLFVDRATKKLVDTGSPFLNMPIREAEVKFKGDRDLAAINALRQTAISEVSKVLSGNTGSGGATEGIRHEAAELMRPDATVGQIIETAKALRADMANRKTSINQQLAEIRGRISGKPAASAGSGLTKAEQDELKRLEARFGGKP